MTVRSRSGTRTALVVGAGAAALLVAAALAWWLPGADSRSDAPAAGAPTAPGAVSPGEGSPGEVSPGDPAPSGAGAPGAPPSAGSLDPVPYEEVTPRVAGSLTATADFGTGLTLRVTDVEEVRSQARRPGEISAPAVRLTMRARNSGPAPISLEGMVVTLEHGPERTPAVAVLEPGGKPFAGTLRPGASRRGVYVFNVPRSGRGQIRLTTSYSGAAPTLVLTGAVA